MKEEGGFASRKLEVNGVRSSGARQTIDNPFLTFDDIEVNPETHRTELEEYIWQFAVLADLKDRYELLRFGARLARDKHEAISRYNAELTDREKTLISNEKGKDSGFWKQSKFFRATIMTASLGGMIQGWTQSANNGTAHGMPQEFNLCIKNTADCSSSDLWTFGMLNAVPLLSAGLFGTLVADPLQENFLGRRGSVMLSCAITIASTIGASVTHTVGQLAACRAINGVALGAKASIIPIYSAELAPEHIRGAILANWQLADAAGIFFGFLVNLLTVVYVKNPSSAWRILTSTILIPTIPLLAMIYLMPESPRYLMKHGRYRKALESFEQVQTTPLLASRDFMYAHAQLDFESRMMNGSTNEYGTLAERLENSTTVSLQQTSPSAPTRDHLEVPRIQPSVLLAPLPRHSQDDDNAITEVRSIPRISHQSRIRPQSNSQNSDPEPKNIERAWSDISSLNFEAVIQRAKKKGNPYSYHIGVTGYYKRLIELWQNKRCRRALLAASVSMITQQLSGVNTIAFLSTIIWTNSIETNSEKTAAIIGLAFGAASYLFGLPAYWLADKVGRSNLLCLGLPNMAWSILVFGFLFHIKDQSVSVPMVSIFAIIFVAFYAPTAGTVPFSISAEVFPLVSREAGMAVSVAVNLLGAGILVLVFPFVFDSIGSTSSFCIFAGLNMVAFVLVYLFVPETRMRTLEELQYTFDLPTRWHIEYRMVYMRRHISKNWSKYVTGKKVDPPVPFYEWARVMYGQIEQTS